MIETKGKTLLEALEEAKNMLGTENIVYSKTKEEDNSFNIKAISFNQLVEDIENYLSDVLEHLGLLVNFESNVREETINITMYSNNNPILIGKNGQTLKALETLVKNKVKQDWGFSPKIILDVENYKERRIDNLERLAIKVAKEVRATKVDAELENMNSFERRIIHNKLTNFKGVATESVGVEPNRHVVIKSVDKE